MLVSCQSVSLDVQENDQRETLLISNTAQTDNMSVNSSSSSADDFYCSNSRLGLFISTAFSVTNTFLLLPLSILVLHLGHQQWRQQRSFASTSHSDIFTYQMSVLELILAFGGTLYLYGSYSGLSEVVTVGIYVSSIVFPGQISFHILTCVERYLAVVHPVTYMGLRQSGGVKIRNISIVCVWLLCFGWCAVHRICSQPVIMYFCSLVFSLIVVSFCSLRVLCVLIRPGPGEVGGDRERVDQSKQRAFHTIMAIMGVLCLWFAGIIVPLALKNTQLLGYSDGCAVLFAANWLGLPSSLVLPLLFLHRAGKLDCCH